MKTQKNILLHDLIIGIIAIIAGFSLIYADFILNAPTLVIVVIAVFVGMLSGVIIVFIFFEAMALKITKIREMGSLNKKQYKISR